MGGAVNAWLCYAEVPAPVKDATFAWHVVPAGGFHGAVLAAIPWILGTALARKPAGLRLAAALPLGWLAGFVSWIPLNWSAFEEPWLESLVWPLSNGWSGALLGPFQAFGLVLSSRGMA